jgi:hypothetical protein
LYGIFYVEDRYVRCVYQNFQDPVYKDACVEFFVQPSQTKGYFNFEFNCGGSLLSNYNNYKYDYHGNCKRLMKKPLTEEDRQLIQIYHTLPEVIEEEITGPVDWQLGFFIPFELFERYIGKIENIPGQTWRANFYKCASESSHPHWAAWSPVDQLNFHLVHCFGTIKFGFAGKR